MNEKPRAVNAANKEAKLSRSQERQDLRKVIKKLAVKKSVWKLRKIYAAKRGDGLNFQVPSPEAQPFGKKNLGEGGRRSVLLPTLRPEERGKMGSKSAPFQDRCGGGGGEAEN